MRDTSRRGDCRAVGPLCCLHVVALTSLCTQTISASTDLKQWDWRNQSSSYRHREKEGPFLGGTYLFGPFLCLDVLFSVAFRRTLVGMSGGMGVERDCIKIILIFRANDTFYFALAPFSKFVNLPCICLVFHPWRRQGGGGTRGTLPGCKACAPGTQPVPRLCPGMSAVMNLST